MYGRGVYGKALYGVYTVKESGAAVHADADVAVTPGRARLLSAAAHADADVAGRGAVDTFALASLSALATMASDSAVRNVNGANLFAASAVNVMEGRVLVGAGAEVSTGSAVDFEPSVLIFGAPRKVASISLAEAVGNLLAVSPAKVMALATLTADGRGIYVAIPSEEEHWTETTPETDVWTPVPEATTIWTETPVNG